MICPYIFLRDQQLANFASIDRMTSQLNALYTRMEGSTPTETEETSVSMCQKCKQKSFHKGWR